MSRLFSSSTLLFVGAFVSIVLTSSDARATHRNWVLKNAGGQCAFESPIGESAGEYNDFSIHNGGTNIRSVTCPVALAGRWGSSSPVLAAPTWAGSLAANVYSTNQSAKGESVSCYASGRLNNSGSSTGTVYYSRTVANAALGDQKISIMAWRSDWGLSLQTHKLETVRGMTIHCLLPGNQSKIDGYKVKICQNGSSNGTTGECYHVATNQDGDASWVDEGDFVAGQEYVQTSGIECVPGLGYNFVQRTAAGIKNNGDWAYIYCPIVPSADDSREVKRKITSVKVYYKGGPVGSFPMCQLRWKERPGTSTYTGGTVVTSPAFDDFPANGYVKINSANTKINLEIYSAVSCDVPTGMTIQGVTTFMEVAKVDSGSN